MMNPFKRLLRRGPTPRAVPTLVPREEALRVSIDEFWRNWFRTKGARWPNEYRTRMDPNAPLNVELAQHVTRRSLDVVDILDVGAGPASIVGKRMEGKTVRLTPTDLCAAAYDRLIAEFRPPVPAQTIFADAENLVAQFGRESFDIVFAQNAVDHMERPLLAIDQMIECCRPGGMVFLRHEENAGRATNYSGLPHWDASLDDASQHFVIRHALGESHDVSIHTASLGTSRVYRVGRRFVWEFIKNELPAAGE